MGRHAPLIVMSSEDPGYRGDAGLEMIFHEASHLLVERVQGMLDQSARRQSRTIPPSLWHLLLFYTAGHLTRERLGPNYVPYAERPENRIFVGDAARVLVALETAWQPYLDGASSLDSAIDALVRSF